MKVCKFGLVWLAAPFLGATSVGAILVSFSTSAFAQVQATSATDDATQTAPAAPVTDTSPTSDDQRKTIPSSMRLPLRIASSPGVRCALDVDLGMRRLMACSSAGTSLLSLSLDTGNVRPLPVKSINDMAVDADDTKIFATTDDQSLLVLDRRSLVRIDKIVLPGHCGAVAYVPSCHKVLIAHTTENVVWSVDAHLHTLGATMRVHGAISQLVYDAASDKVLGLCSTNEIAVIDPWSMTVVSYWTLTPSTKITGIGADSGLGVVFAGDTNGQVSVLDAHSGAVLASVDTQSPISSLAYDSFAQQIYCLSQYQGVVTVVQIARGGSALDLGQVSTVTGMQSAAVIRGGSDANLWVSFADERGSYIQDYTLRF